MKKIILFTLSAVTILSFVSPPEAACRQAGNLYNMLSGMDEVKAHVADITQSGGEMKADLESLRKVLEDALATRMTINFALVPKKENADIVIYCDIFEFFWTDKDPVDNIAGLGPIMMDAISRQNYARMQAVFTITDAGGGKELWHKKLKATITSKEMTRQDSLSMMNEKIVKIFMRDCFSRTHGEKR